MSILNNFTSVLDSIKLPGIRPGEDCKSEGPQCEREYDKDCKPTKTDECDKETKWNNDHKGEYDKDHSKDGDWKYAKHEDHKDDCNSNDGKQQYSNHDGEWKYAKGEDCQTQKDDCKEVKYDSCEQHNDPCPPKPCDTDCKSTVHYNENPGEVLAKLDFSSHGDLGSYDHSSEMHGALASMSSGHALDYAIGQMGPTEHFDPGHFDLPVDAHASHDVHVA